MVNLKTTLKEFVLQIPTCYKNSQLNHWISTLYDSPLGMVAIIDHNETPQGVIQNHCLLRLMTQKLSNSKNVSQNIDQDFGQEAILPLASLPSQMKVEDFLARYYLRKQEHKQNYFVVNEAGKLLGILDLSKILQTLWCNQVLSQQGIAHLTARKHSASGSNCDLEQEIIANFDSLQTGVSLKEKSSEKVIDEEQTIELKKQIEFREINSAFYSLLTQISLPLIVKNIRGEVCYQNDYWNQDLLESLDENKTITNWLTFDSKQVSLEAKSNYNNYHCATASNFSVVPSSKSELQRKINHLDVKFGNFTADKKLLTTGISEHKETAKSEVTRDSWYYYRLPLEINVNSITITDSPNYWLIFATKIPLQQSLVDESWQQRQFKLKQLQDEFILNISHDIKSPLTAIIGLSSLLKEEKLGTLNNSQIRYTKMIHHSGKRLISLINDFLDITHLATKKLQFNFESIEIKSTCKQLYDRVTNKLKTVATVKQHDVPIFAELQLDIAPDAQYAIADKAYFCQIITRLLENALQLVSSEELFGVTAECWSNWLAVTIWNEGGGLSEAQQNFLTREFSQYTNLLTSEGKNQGLGLILAQQLAQAHGGDVSIISQSNYGSEFTLLLPLKPDRFKSQTEILDEHINCSDTELNHNLVLIVETASKRIVDLNDKLKILGYHCAIARNTAEALYKARCLKPYKILLNSSFLETGEPNNIVATLKTDPTTCNIPLLIINSTFSKQNSFNNLADEILSFPISKATLAQFFTPIVSRQSILTQNLTVLRLSLQEESSQQKENLALDFVFENPSFSLSHHIIEADSLEQAHLLAGIWDIDAIIWDGVTLKSPETYLESFAESDILASIPVITLDAKTTAAANKIANLAVFPCLLPAKERSIQQLTQVIQIAAGFG